MTEEQIEKNAEEYAINNGYEPPPKGGWIDCTATDTYGISVESYTEGAHSRDEEIEELELKIAKLEHEKDLLSAAYRTLEWKLNKLDPEWMTK